MREMGETEFSGPGAAEAPGEITGLSPAFFAGRSPMPHPVPPDDLQPIDRLRAIMHILRAPGGCPWDAEQTHESLAPHLVEESYEVAAAIRAGNVDDLVEELGDVLLQPVFHAEIASETDAFDFDDVAHAICEKLIRRHPHVFGESELEHPEEVLRQWEEIKSQEKSGPEGHLAAAAKPATDAHDSAGLQASLIKSANEGIPALMAAQKIQKKAARVGFDWPEIGPVLDKVAEELNEVARAVDEGHPEAIAEEVGDLLFAVVNLARKTGNQAELLMDGANRKFVDRFRRMEARLVAEGRSLEQASLEEMDRAWENAKAETR